MRPLEFMGANMRRRTFITLLGGAAATWPLLAGAQQVPKFARIGLLTEGSFENPVVRANFDAIREEFGQLGYLAGKNITFEERGADATAERLPALAAELVRLRVDVIVALATPAGRAAKHATNTIPIVIGSMADPVADGLVASLSSPGGNVTGTTFLGPELLPKRLVSQREKSAGPERQPLEGRARIFNPSPHCCVATSLYRFNIRRRLSKIPMSCQISFTTFSVAPSTSRSTPAKEASSVRATTPLRRLYGVRSSRRSRRTAILRRSACFSSKCEVNS